MRRPKIPSIRPRMDNAKYRAANAVSKSDLDLFVECPAKFKAWQDGLLVRNSTPAMSFGTLLHSLVLDGRADFYAKPDGMTFASKEGREWRDQHADKPIVSADEAKELHAIASAIARHPHASRVLAGGKPEVSLFGRHAETGIELKGRCDLLCAGHIVDLKTIHSADNRSCVRAIADYGYHRQAWMYRELANQNGLAVREFYFVFIERGQFPLFNVKRITEAAIELGGMEVGRALRQMKQARETGVWQDYSGIGEIGEIDLPQWCYNDTSGMAMLPKEEMNASDLDSETVDLIP